MEKESWFFDCRQAVKTANDMIMEIQIAKITNVITKDEKEWRMKIAIRWRNHFKKFIPLQEKIESCN